MSNFNASYVKRVEYVETADERFKAQEVIVVNNKALKDSNLLD